MLHLVVLLAIGLPHRLLLLLLLILSDLLGQLLELRIDVTIGLIGAWLLLIRVLCIAFLVDGVLALMVRDLAPDNILRCTWIHMQDGAHRVCSIAASGCLGRGFTDLGRHYILDVTIQGSLRST